MELIAIKMVAGGDALARQADGRMVMLRGALPGERVSARVVSEKRHFASAVTEQVLEAAAIRRQPPCPLVARGCGGCDWQHVADDAALMLKTAMAQDALERTGRIADVTVRAAGRIPAEGYRTTLRLALAANGFPGFRAARSHQVVPTPGCLVAHPDLQPLLATLRLPGGRELVLRLGAGSGERLAWCTPESLPRPDALPEDVAWGPDSAVHEVVEGARLRVSARSFFQSSPQAAALLTRTVRAAAGAPEDWGDGPVVDAYGGVGLYAVTVAPAGRPVRVLESSPFACDDARANLEGRDATVEQVAVERWRSQPAALVIANPARSGLGAAATARLSASGARRLVLVSCDPVSFARDARLLVDAGYRLTGADAVDLFPNTHHVEVVGAFSRA
jgi:23S rRNA (uracil1939-C5)-methyltransferase